MTLRDVHFTIPETVGELPGFREWAASAAFPERGRIDFLQGAIEVDISPENLQSHGQPKGELFAYIKSVVGRQGQIFCDRSRLIHPLWGFPASRHHLRIVGSAAERSSSLRKHPMEEGTERQIEIVGAATLVVEIVSDSSVSKD